MEEISIVSYEARAPQHRLQTHVLWRLYCGTTKRGSQFVLGHDGGDNAILLEFDTAGQLLETADGVFPRSVEYSNDPTLDFYSLFFDLQFTHPLAFELGTIHIEEFHHDEFEIGVAARPCHFEELQRTIADPSTAPDQREWLASQIRQWNGLQQYVLTWFNEYYVTEGGLIVGS